SRRAESFDSKKRICHKSAPVTASSMATTVWKYWTGHVHDAVSIDESAAAVRRAALRDGVRDAAEHGVDPATGERDTADRDEPDQGDDERVLDQRLAVFAVEAHVDMRQQLVQTIRHRFLFSLRRRSVGDPQLTIPNPTHGHHLTALGRCDQEPGSDSVPRWSL